MTAGAPAALLDSYEIERRPVGRRNVAHADLSHANDREQQPGPAVADDTPEGARARQALADAIVPAQTRKVITDGLALGYRYDPSPIVWQDGTPAPEDTVTDYHPTARPGSRAPHAFIAPGRSTIDLFGKGFVLVRLGTRAPGRIGDRARVRAARRAAHDRDDRESRRGRALPTRAGAGAARRPRRLARRCAAGRPAGACRPRARSAASDLPPRRSACRRDRRGGSCRADIWRAASAARRPRNRNRAASGASWRFCLSTSARFFLKASMLWHPEADVIHRRLLDAGAVERRNRPRQDRHGHAAVGEMVAVRLARHVARFEIEHVGIEFAPSCPRARAAHREMADGVVLLPLALGIDLGAVLVALLRQIEIIAGRIVRASSSRTAGCRAA